MQIKALAIYSHDGQRKELEFRIGALNVVSGLSNTGKTTLVKIIDFCFGRGRALLPTGPIKNKVAWMALHLESPAGELVVARPAPTGQTSQRAMVIVGTDLSLPEYAELAVNSDTTALRRQLDRLVGLGAYEQTSYGSRDVLRPGIQHGILFCLQTQTELISDQYLFHRQDDAQIARDLRELFPFFLGAIDEDRLDEQHRLNAARRAMQTDERRLARLEARAGASSQREQALLREAVKLGLIADADYAPDERRAVLASLAEHAETEDTSDAPEAPPQAPLRRRVQDARQQLRVLKERRAALAQIGSDGTDHRHEAEIQLGRLGVLPVDDDDDSATDRCPLCGAELPVSDTTVAALIADARRLEAKIGALAEATSDLAAAEAQLQGEVDAADGELKAALADLEAAVGAEAAAKAEARAAERRAYLRGAIGEYLLAADATAAEDGSALRARIDELGREISALEHSADPSAIRAEAEARLDVVAADMTAWARDLQLEHANDGIARIGRTTLTVELSTNSGRMRLDEIGGGANHVGYNLVAHLGLHRHFIRARRPVPRFIVFDQPSLPFFPTNVPRDEGAADVDWDTVKHYIQTINRVADAQGGDMQVLVTEHALFPDEEWFRKALLADWHGDEKLVPMEWPDAPLR
jgi:hypothetical protein